MNRFDPEATFVGCAGAAAQGRPISQNSQRSKQSRRSTDLFFVTAYVEQHKTNRTGHWITTANGTYRSMPYFAIAGENVVISDGVDVRDGSE